MHVPSEGIATHITNSYVLVQVEARSHEVWGGEEGLEAERVNKMKRREKRKEKKYAKDIKGDQAVVSVCKYDFSIC